MATASSRRPQTNNSDLEQEEDQTTGYNKTTEESQQLKVNKYEIFKNTMGSWYLHLPTKPKAKLLKRHIIKKAKQETDKLGMSYSILDPNWLRELHEEHGVDFYEPSPEEKIRRKEFGKLSKKLMNPSTLDEPMEVEEVEQLLRLTVGSISNEMIKQVMKKVQTKAEVEIGEKLLLLTPRLYCPSNYKILPVLKKESKKERTNTAPSNQFEGMKCMDLLHEPPPKLWMDSYKKGKILPRTMKCQHLSDKKTVVVYYDYDNISKMERPSDFEPKIHESNHVFGMEELENGSL